MSTSSKHTKVAWFTIFAALSVFVLITFLLLSPKLLGILSDFDNFFYSLILKLRYPGITGFMKAVTFLGNTSTVTFLCILFIIRSPRFGALITVPTLISAIIHQALKFSIVRPRPYFVEHMVSAHGYSFPSGHSCTGLLFYFILAYSISHIKFSNPKMKYLGYIFYAIPFFIGISRVYLRVHFPSDVLAGWSLGLAFFAIFLLYQNRTGISIEEYIFRRRS